MLTQIYGVTRPQRVKLAGPSRQDLGPSVGDLVDGTSDDGHHNSLRGGSQTSTNGKVTMDTQNG